DLHVVDAHDKVRLDPGLGAGLEGLFLLRRMRNGGVGDAAVAHTPEEKETLEARAKAGIEANLVVGVYDVKVALGENGPWPVARREQIKASHSTTIAVGPEAQLSDAA
ncbi:MAG: DUF2849 domain-containing protein, partial [Pseudomonadota bacterium]